MEQHKKAMELSKKEPLGSKSDLKEDLKENLNVEQRKQRDQEN